MPDSSVDHTIDYLKNHDLDHLNKLLLNTWKVAPSRSDNKHEHEMWKEQVAVNLPILYLASICLHRFAQDLGIKHFLFATRDCAHWYKIYSAMYPEDDAHYFHCSRNMFNIARTRPRPYYYEYVRQATGDFDIKHTIFIDIHGTGRRMYEYFAERHDRVPACYLLSTGSSCVDNLFDGFQYLHHKGRAKALVYSASGSPIEMLNYDIIGTCNDYGRYGDIRAPLEYNLRKVKIYHDCVDRFVKMINRYGSDDTNYADTKYLRRYIRKLFDPILDDVPKIGKWITHEKVHR